MADEKEIVAGELDDVLTKEIEDAVADAVKKPEADVVPETDAVMVSDERATSDSDSPDTAVGELTDDATKPTAELDSSVGGDEVVPAVSEETLTRAIRAGMSYADARSFTDEGMLARVTESMESVRTPVEGKTDAQPEDLFAALPQLDPEKYEPEVIQMYDGLVAVIKKQQESLAALQANQSQGVQVTRESHAREVESWFDEQISKLGDEFSDTLGKGAYRTLDRGSSQFAKRDAIANKVAVLVAGYSASGQKTPPREELFVEAAQLVLKGDYLKAKENRLSSDLAKRAKQHINRVDGRKGKDNQSPIDATAALINEKFFSKS